MEKVCSSETVESTDEPTRRQNRRTSSLYSASFDTACREVSEVRCKFGSYLYSVYMHTAVLSFIYPSKFQW
jgi:hypothetical protein